MWCNECWFRSNWKIKSRFLTISQKTM
jgi:hypothetical protein